jgi:predicted thioesterase
VEASPGLSASVQIVVADADTAIAVGTGTMQRVLVDRERFVSQAHGRSQ